MWTSLRHAAQCRCAPVNANVSRHMTVLRVFFRLVVLTLVATVLVAGTSYAAGEVAAAWWVSHHGINYAELAEDRGFGLLLLFVWAVAALIAVPVAGTLGWWVSGRSWRAMANWSLQRTASGGR
jgi:hypothetical protein